MDNKSKKRKLRRNAKRNLNTYIDTLHEKDPIDLKHIMSFPDIAFSSNNGKEEKDPELAEFNDLTDWTPPATERERKQQDDIIQRGVHAWRYRLKKFDTKYPTPDDIDKRYSMNHIHLDPSMLTRYGHAGSVIGSQMAEKYKDQLQSIRRFCIGKLRDTKELLAWQSCVHEFQDSFWIRNSKHPFLASELWGTVLFVLNRLLDIKDSDNVTKLDNSSSSLTLVDNSSINSLSWTNAIYLFTIYWIDAHLPIDNLFLMSVSLCGDKETEDGGNDDNILEIGCTLKTFILFSIMK